MPVQGNEWGRVRHLSDNGLSSYDWSYVLPAGWGFMGGARGQAVYGEATAR